MTPLKHILPSLILLATLLGCSSAPFRFSVVTDNLLRGSRPTCDDLKALRDLLGVRSVVSLESSEAAIGDEKMCATSLGIEFRSIPMSNWTRPTQPQIKEALKYIDSLPSRTFVHCLHGHDRTGVTIAAYRISRQGWTEKAAYDEMLLHGHTAWWYDHFPFYWEKSLKEIAQ